MSWSDKYYKDRSVKPEIGTRVQWSGGPGGWVSHFWGTVARHTKTTVVIDVAQQRLLSEHGDPTYHEWQYEPIWDVPPARQERARFPPVHGSWWAVQNMGIQEYDGKTGTDVAYY